MQDHHPEDPLHARVIGNRAQQDSEVLRELYANIWSPSRSICRRWKSTATPSDKLTRFANEQFTAQNDRIALPAFEYLASLDEAFDRTHASCASPDPVSQWNYGSSAQILLQISAEPQMREQQNLFRKGVNLATRKLLEDSLATAKDIPAALDWYGDARQFCNNNFDLRDGRRWFGC